MEIIYMKNISNNKKILSVIGVLIAVAIIYGFAHRTASLEGGASVNNSNISMATSSMTTSTSTDQSAPTFSVNPNQIFAYYLDIATTTFSQNDVIPMTLFAYNLSSIPQTMSFSNGCAGKYSIADFDMMKHITCVPGATSFVVDPHGVRKVFLEHYPSVYRIPVGRQSLYTGVVGYGGITTEVTITP